MRLCALAFGLLLLASDLFAQTISPPLVTASQRAIWDREKAENHTYFQQTCAEGAKDTTTAERYGSSGRWSALCRQMGGDVSMSQRSYGVLKRRSTDFSVPIDSGNDVREHFTEAIVTLTWIAPDLTPAEIQAAKAWLVLTADTTIKTIRLNDSDQVTGTLMGLLTMDRVFGTTYGTLPIVQNMRKAVTEFVAKSAGGGWVEYGDYDWGTLYLLLNGAEAAGIQHFSEVVALRTELLKAIPQWFTPDLKDTLELGDDQSPGSVPRHAMEDLLAILGHHSAEVRGFEAEVRQVRNWPFGQPFYARYFTWADPFGERKPWREFVGTRLVNPGLGKLYTKTGWTPEDCGFLSYFAPLSNGIGGIDHVYGWFGHWRLYCEGKFIRDSPIAYSNNLQLANQTILAGLPAAGEVGVFSAQRVGPIEYATGTNAGLNVNSGYYDPPATFRYELSPSLFYIPSWRVVVKIERIHVDDPKTQMLSATKTSLSRFSAAQQTNIKAAPLIRSIWHSQTVQPTIQNGTIVGEDRITPLYPATFTVVDMAPNSYGTILASEKKWFVQADPVDQTQGFRVLTTIAGDATGTIEQIGTVQKLRLTKAGQRDIVIYSSVTPGPKLTTSKSGASSVYDRTKVDGILAARVVTMGDWGEVNADVFVEQAGGLVQLNPPAPVPPAPPSDTPARKKIKEIKDRLLELEGLVP